MKDFTEIPVHKCLTCHYKLEVASSVFKQDKGAVPSKDDFSVCLKCGTITKFDEQLNLIALTEGELSALMRSDPETYIKLRKCQVVICKMTKDN